MDNTACSNGPRFSNMVVAAMLAGAAVLLAPVAGQGFLPKTSLCSDLTSSCLATKCCKDPDYTCFQTGNTARCGLRCPTGGSCQVLTPAYMSKPVTPTDDSMYCYTVFVGEPSPRFKVNPKYLAILKFQKANGLGVFGCNAFGVFSDVTVDYGGATATKVVPTVDWKKYFRKDKPDRYLTTPLFMGVWKQIKAEGTFAKFSWTVKVDIPTVFLPGLLRSSLSFYPETPSGTYIETCNKVLAGYFGNLGIASKIGMTRFLEQFESNSGGKCWKWDTPECKKSWKYGPWGEDLFMQFTMDNIGVMKKPDFQLADTGTCPGMRPKADKKNPNYLPSCNPDKNRVAVHPLRDVNSWETCYHTLTTAP